MVDYNIAAQFLGGAVAAPDFIMLKVN